ncbi:unnamed protein product [Rotaria socialis]|uniref:VWFA domain-containing protein n=1 Tax=Rotaria socialis TaxID=392032 RepID=A0A820UAR9_9BILA|nr:unnamed protein product [Rotaria socialis]CAF4484040.1 unnamed protein product [Rotaria socialis]
MYPNLGPGNTQPSNRSMPPSTSTSVLMSNPNMNTKPLGFSSLMLNPSAQNATYPGAQSSQLPYPSAPPAPSYTAPYPTNAQSSNASSFSSYSLPNVGQPTATNQGGASSQSSNPPVYPGNQLPLSTNSSTNQNPSPPQQGVYSQNNPQQQSFNKPYGPSNPQQQPFQNPYGSSNPQQQPFPNAYGPSYSQQQPYQNPNGPSNLQQQPFPNAYGPSYSQQQPYQNPNGTSNLQQQPFQNSYGPSYPQQQQPFPNAYGPSYPQQQPYQNPNDPSYPQQQAFQNSYGPSYPQQQQPFPNPNRPSYPQQQPSNNPYAPSYPQQSQGGYPQNDPRQAFGGGYNVNTNKDRIRNISGKYEISDMLAQRLNILQQFEIVVLCDDSGSMNTPVSGTNGTRWDELRAIVQIVIDIGTVFDSNGVDVHFLNRPAMLNVTDPAQVVESFSQSPKGLTPLTPALRRIFQSGASKPNSNKRLLVFIATDGAPTDNLGNVDIRSLENLMRNERQANSMYVTFLACTDDDSSVEYLSQWDRSMVNVDVVDDYKTEREEVRRTQGPNYPFSFGDYVVKALIGAVDPQMDSIDEYRR